MTVTVVSGPERRRRWSAAEKRRIVEESLVGGARVAEVARRHDVHPNLLHGWRRQARTGTPELTGDKAGHFAAVAIAAECGVAAATAKHSSGIEPAIEVMLRNGRVLRVPEGVALRRAAALADVLEGIAR